MQESVENPQPRLHPHARPRTGAYTHTQASRGQAVEHGFGYSDALIVGAVPDSARGVARERQAVTIDDPHLETGGGGGGGGGDG